MNKVVLVTNREIRGDGTRKGHTLLKNKLKQKDAPLRIVEVKPRASKKHWNLNIKPIDGGATFLQKLAQDDNGNGWLIFVHGNNQTAAKNLTKCFKLVELYNVNVLAFSWPSVHYGKIRNWLQFIPVTGASIGGYILKQAFGKIKQYKKAQKVARKSTDDFAEALAMIKTHFLSNLPMDSNTPSIVFHSMGNYLLKKTTQANPSSMADLLSDYGKLILHQADCKNEDHQSWVNSLNHNDVHVTCNKKDGALFFSDFVNHITGENSRLGNVVNVNDAAVAINYKDWTSAHKKAESHGHGLFLTKASAHRQLHTYLEQLFR